MEKNAVLNFLLLNGHIINLMTKEDDIERSLNRIVSDPKTRGEVSDYFALYDFATIHAKYQMMNNRLKNMIKEINQVRKNYLFNKNSLSD